MNLELLDPFGKQIPDRVDSTLSLPPELHLKQGANAGEVSAAKEDDERGEDASGVSSTPGKKKGKNSEKNQTSGLPEEYKGANHLAFNRRGSYVAVGYASGTVAIFDTTSRTVSAIYRKHHSGKPSIPLKKKKSKGDDDVPKVMSDADAESNTGDAGVTDDTGLKAIKSDSGFLSPEKSVALTASTSLKSPPPSKSPSPSLHKLIGNGVTSVSWSRKSRTLLVGAANESLVRLIDTTHPSGPYECASSGNIAAPSSSTAGIAPAPAPITPTITVPPPLSGNNNMNYQYAGNMPSPTHTPANFRRDSMATTSPGAGSNADQVANESSFGETLADISASIAPIDPSPRLLSVKTVASALLVDAGQVSPAETKKRSRSDRTSSAKGGSRFQGRVPSIDFYLPHPIGSALQIHPRHVSAGLAALQDGSLVAFWVPSSAWVEKSEAATEPEPEGPDEGSSKKKSKKKKGPRVLMTTISQGGADRFVTCAAFCPQGDRIYAATQDGHLLGYKVVSIFEQLEAQAEGSSPVTAVFVPKTSFDISIPGGASVWHVLVSRNGRSLVVNSADAAIRLYKTQECWTAPGKVDKPAQVFQDVVQKLKFASCDLSGDGEHCVGGANGNSDYRYEWYVWSTSTGALLDKMSGPPNVELYSVTWHPTRSFVAVAASDGLVDVWGPRINWTAFAPDFQALPSNVEYVEREDEFDIEVEADTDEKKDEADAAGRDDAEKQKNSIFHDYDKDYETNDEIANVDILTVEPVPVFASDSEGEDNVFCFETKITRRRPAPATN